MVLTVKLPGNTTPLHIRNLVTEKRRARSRWQRSRNQGDRAIYNRLKRNLQAAWEKPGMPPLKNISR